MVQPYRIILFRVYYIVSHACLIRSNKVRLRRLPPNKMSVRLRDSPCPSIDLLLQRPGPTSMLDSSGEMIWPCKRFCGLQIHLPAPCCWIIGKVWVHTMDFTGKTIHSPSSLPRFLISPDHRSHISFVVHKPSIKIRSLVWVWRHNVSRTTAEGILEKMKHAEEFAWGKEHVISEESVYSRKVSPIPDHF